MATITSVSVLAPNGRRQVVKLTPNTTILQILEEVCKKQGFKSEAFELRHQNRSLDLTAVIRFSGLPNLASLEMAEASKARTETAVGLVLQLESNKRVAGDFMPTTSLWEVISTLAPESQSSDSAIVYLRREVSGRQQLDSTTLRDLGLTGGRALLRLVAAATDGPRQQANVSAPLVRPAASITSRMDQSSGSQPMEVDEPSGPQPAKKRETELVRAAIEEQKKQHAEAQEQERKQRVAAQEKERQKMEAALERERQKVLAAQERERQIAEAVLEQERQQQFAKEMKELEQQIVLVGERDAVVFRAESSHAALDLPDDFFETTVEDARVLYRDLKAAAESLTEAPLLTSALRNQDPEPAPVPAVLRVQFPDRVVLQATFRPVETVADVMTFVRSQLNDSTTPFILFTTPPRYELPPNATLREVGCANGCLLHFAPTGSGTNGGNSFLREEPLTSAPAAALLASRARGVRLSAPAASTARIQRQTGHGHASGSTALSSGSQAHSSGQTPGPGTGQGCVPKWFKPV